MIGEGRSVANCSMRWGMVGVENCTTGQGIRKVFVNKGRMDNHSGWSGGGQLRKIKKPCSIEQCGREAIGDKQKSALQYDGVSKCLTKRAGRIGR